MTNVRDCIHHCRPSLAILRRCFFHYQLPTVGFAAYVYLPTTALRAWPALRLKILSDTPPTAHDSTKPPFAFPRNMLILSTVMLTVHFWIFILRVNGYPYYQPSYYKPPTVSAYDNLCRKWRSFTSPGSSPPPPWPSSFLSKASDTTANAHDYLLGSDTKAIAIDNCSTHHVTPDQSAFVPGSFQPGTSGAVGLGGNTVIAGTGAVHWEIVDDDGIPHLFCLTNVSYVPTCPYRLISIGCLSKHFCDSNSQATTITSGNHFSDFVWDHSKFS